MRTFLAIGGIVAGVLLVLGGIGGLRYASEGGAAGTSSLILALAMIGGGITLARFSSHWRWPPRQEDK